MARKKTVNLDELREKYGDTKIMVCPSDFVDQFLPAGLTLLTRDANLTNIRRSQFRIQLNGKLTPMLRAEAECNPGFKQPISYVIVRDKAGNIFVTKRKAGDKRLVGMCSIGTGGHVDEGEDLYSAMYRELKEEIGVDQDNIFSYKFTGYILDNSTQVNSVHLGLYVELLVDNPNDVAVKEVDKLEGAWMTEAEVKALSDDGKLESWSKIYVDGGGLN